MKHIITTYTRAILLMIMMLLMPSLMWADKEAYAEYADGTLTFHYDENRASSTATTYSLPAANVLPGWLEHQDDITKVVFLESFKDVRPKRCSKWFYQMSSLTDITGLEYLNTSNVNDMSNMFYGCKSLKALDLSQFCTDSVTTMTRMFYECESLTALDVTTFNTRKVDDMSYMFGYCSKLTELDLSTFCTQKVTNMKGMFTMDNALTHIDVIDFFVTDQVSSSKDMFMGCVNLPGFDKNSTDKTKAPEYLTYLPAQPWAEYQEATKTLTFHNNNTKLAVETTAKYDLPTIGAPGWIGEDIEHVVFNEDFAQLHPKSCSQWFFEMIELTDIQGLEYLCTDSVTDMSQMFSGCRSLTTLDLTFLDTRNVTDMRFMFANDTALTHIYVSDRFVTSRVRQSVNMFYGCHNLPSFDSSCTDTTNIKVYLTYLSNQIWVEYQEDTYTLTFHNDSRKDLITATAKYALPPSGADPEWLDQDIRHVVFLRRFAEVRPKRCHKWFYDMEGLGDICGLEYLCTDSVNDMSYMFYQCASLTSLDLSGFNTERVTTMTGMFYDCFELKKLDLSSFSTEKVDDMSEMFCYCGNLTELDLSSFSTEQVTTMKSMFSHCGNLTKLNLSSFNTERVTTMNNMFAYCSSLTSLDLSALNTANVRDMRSMFYQCSNLTELDLSTLNTSSVQDMTYMFFRCSNLTALDLSSFNTEQLRYMYSMFGYCTSLTELNLSSFNTERVTNMEYLFYDCARLTELDLSSFNTERVTTMHGMFSNCTNLTGINLSSFNTAIVEDMAYMFYACNQLTALDLSSFNTDKVTNMAYMFCYCNHLKDLNVSTLCTEKVTNMTCMFYACNQLTALDLSSFNTGKVDNMNSMFDGCSSLTSLDLSSFNTANVRDMAFMFNWCYNLTELNLSSFNTEKVDTMYCMFGSCVNLTELDLSSFNTANVKDMMHMFDMGNNGGKLEKICVSEQFVTDNVKGFDYDMFNGCTALAGYDANQVGKEKAHYKAGGYLTLRRHLTVGEDRYNVDGYDSPTCYTDVSFTDGAAYSAPCAFTFDADNTASYTRSVSNHWATLCLPFAFSADDNATASFYSVGSYADGNIAVTALTGTIAAGTPVLAYVSGGKELSVSATGAAAVDAPVSNDNLKGTFTQTEVADEDYIIANDHFWNARWLKSAEGSSAAHVYVAPYRASLTLNLSTGAKPNSISISEGETDGINGAASIENLLDGGVTDPSVLLYDLQGRRLTAPQCGMMIIRKGGVSRKVVVK